MKKIALLALFWGTLGQATPYPDPKAVPTDPRSFLLSKYQPRLPKLANLKGQEILRVDVSWTPKEVYEVSAVKLENSGTDALLKRSPHEDSLGSFKGRLIESQTGKVLAHDSLGIGADFRLLTRAMSFRFPKPTTGVYFEMSAENPKTGKMEVVLNETIRPGGVIPTKKLGVDVRLIHSAKVSDPLIVGVYAEGYLKSRKAQFFQDAQRAVKALKNNNFPGFNALEFRAVFAPSNKKLPSAQKLGFPIPKWDSFLSLYYPYWGELQRWYHIVYATREEVFRDGIGQSAYDYPLVLVDSTRYWGVGNFKELTAIPSQNSSFTYLLLHELGHFFGLNEEYESGGKTELAFAPQISEPWSQNITFLRNGPVKWASFVDPATPIPTPKAFWGRGRYGAYKGGYAQTPPYNQSHKPGWDCVMSNRGNFCEICRHAIKKRIEFDRGKS